MTIIRLRRSLVAALVAAAIMAGPSAAVERQPVLTGLVVRSATEVFVVSSSSVLESRDAGDTWRTIRVPGVRSIGGAHLRDGTRWWIASGAAGARRITIADTRDGGKSWRQSLLAGNYPHGHALVRFSFRNERQGWLTVGRDNIASATVDLYRTTDGGAAWRLLGSFPLSGPIEFAAGKLWAVGGVTNQSLYVSSNGGSTWRRVGVPTPAGLRRWPRTIAFLPSEHGIAIEHWYRRSVGKIAAGHYRTTFLLATSPDGRHWSNSLPLGSLDSSRVVGEGYPAAPASDGNWLVTDYGGWTSHSGSRGWTRARAQNPPFSVRQFAFPTARVGFSLLGRTIPCSSSRHGCTLGTTVAKTTDGGRTWRALTLDEGTDSAPRCGPSHLASSAGFAGATGSMLGSLRLRNTSGRACSLPAGVPAVEIVWHGKVLKTREIPLPDFEPSVGLAAPVRVLEPGTSAFVWLQWQNWCGQVDGPAPAGLASSGPTLNVQFAGRPTISVPVTAWSRPRCDSRSAGSALLVGPPLRSL